MNIKRLMVIAALCVTQMMSAQTVGNNEQNTDGIFAQVEMRMRYLLQQTEQLRKVTPDKGKLMPRSVEKDGSLRLVNIGD